MIFWKLPALLAIKHTACPGWLFSTHLTNLRTSGTRILERGSAILGFKPATHFHSSSLKLAWSTRPHSIPSSFLFQYQNRSSTEECHFIASSEPDWTTPPTPSGQKRNTNINNYWEFDNQTCNIWWFFEEGSKHIPEWLHVLPESIRTVYRIHEHTCRP